MNTEGNITCWCGLFAVYMCFDTKQIRIWTLSFPILKTGRLLSTVRTACNDNQNHNAKATNFVPITATSNTLLAASESEH